MPKDMPKYVELYSILRQAIQSGEYPANSFLPTENELVERYNVSKTTIRHAIKLLREYRMVEVRQGSGTRVLPIEQEVVTGKKYNTTDADTTVLVRYASGGSGEVNNTKAAIDKVPADDAIAAALKIPPGTAVYRLQRLQLADGLPFGYMVNYIPEELVPDLMSKGELTIDLYGFLARNYDIRVNAMEETIDAIAAGFMEAQYLQTELGTPLLLLKRIATGNGRPVEYCETTMRPDIFQMVIKIKYSDGAGDESFMH